MLEIVKTAHVPIAPEMLWPLVSEPEHLSEWFAFADRIEVLDGEGPGRHQRLHGHWGKKRSEIDQLVTEFDPPHRLTWEHIEERLDGRPAPKFAASTRFSIEVSPAGEGSSVTLTSRQHPAGPLRGAVMKMFGKKEIAGRLEESAQKLVTVATSPR